MKSPFSIGIDDFFHVLAKVGLFFGFIPDLSSFGSLEKLIFERTEAKSFLRTFQRSG